MKLSHVIDQLDKVSNYIDAHPQLFILVIPFLVKHAIKGIKYLHALPPMKRKKILVRCAWSIVAFFIVALGIYSYLTSTVGVIPPSQAVIIPNDSDYNKYLTYQPCEGTKTIIDTNLIRNNVLDVRNLYKMIPAQQCHDNECGIIRVPYGRILTLRLPDNSVVTLKGGSALCIPFGYGVSHRNLTLAGEAYFDVAKDSRWPFHVYSEGKIVTALGTAFNIRGFRDLSYMHIAVVSGRVQLEDANRKHLIYLDHDNCAKIDLENDSWWVGEFNNAIILGWLEGKYIMQGRTIGEVCKEMERCHGEEIVIDNPAIAKQTCWVIFSQDKPIKKTFAELSESNKIKCYKLGEVWHITSTL